MLNFYVDLFIAILNFFKKSNNLNYSRKIKKQEKLIKSLKRHRSKGNKVYKTLDYQGNSEDDFYYIQEKVFYNESSKEDRLWLKRIAPFREDKIVKTREYTYEVDINNLLSYLEKKIDSDKKSEKSDYNERKEEIKKEADRQNRILEERKSSSSVY